MACRPDHGRLARAWTRRAIPDGQRIGSGRTARALLGTGRARTQGGGDEASGLEFLLFEQASEFLGLRTGKGEYNFDFFRRENTDLWIVRCGKELLQIMPLVEKGLTLG